jgi:hypothetical protein
MGAGPRFPPGRRPSFSAGLRLDQRFDCTGIEPDEARPIPRRSVYRSGNQAARIGFPVLIYVFM